MFNRKLLLISLLTLVSMVGLFAQNQVHVHGTVTNTDADPQDSVNILVSALFADSSAVFYSLYTVADGTYEADITTPGPNLFGSVVVSMVDCWGTSVSQSFIILNGNEDFQADFVYCEDIVVDSCIVFILEEWIPGTIDKQLTAWTIPGVDVDFLWSTGETTPTIIPQQSGHYSVVATFDIGCVAEDSIYVNLDSLNCFAYIVSSTNSDGTYNLEVVPSGIAPFSYSWSDGTVGDILENVGPGTYCVVVTDATGCVYSTCFFINDPNFCEVYIYEDPAGALIANAYGVAPFSYLWNTGEVSDVIFPNTPGLYCVTVNDANGCESSSCIDNSWGFDSCYVFVTAYIEDSSTFTLQAIVSSQAQSFSFLWSNGDTTQVIHPEDPSQSYCVTVTDSDGCVSVGCYDSANWCYAWVDLQYVDTTTAVLTVLSDPIFNWPGNTNTYVWSTGDTTPTITVTESGDYCATVTLGGNCVTETCVTVDFDALGEQCTAWVYTYPDTNNTGQWTAEAWAWGFGTFEYAWSNGDTNSVTTLNSPNEFLCVTVTSSFGCETVACVDTFYSPCEALISVTYLNDSIAVLTASVFYDPNQNAVFEWNTGNSGPEIAVGQSGTYCVTVYAGGCVNETCVEVDFSNVVLCGVWISEESGPGAGIEYTANAWGVPPFTYLWSNGGTEQTNFVDFGIHDLCVTVTDANGCVSDACNYPVDSCYALIYYNTTPTPSLYVETGEPLAQVLWSTGDTVAWIEISAPGTYCATVTTIFGCVTTTCITIDSIIPGGAQNVINGFVYGDTLAGISGIVYAYEIDANSENAFVVVDSSLIDPTGYYSIGGLKDGAYLLKAVMTPGTPQADDYVPTYHYSSTSWETAYAHILPNWLPVTTDIFMIRSTDFNGGGVIGGVITDPDHFVAEENGEHRGLDGINNIEVLLSDESGNSVTYTLSLQDGSFRFTGLPWGTYRVRFDIPGITSPDIWVTLTPEDPERLQVNLIVNDGTTAVSEPTSEEIKLYPNPAKDEINMPLPGINTTYAIQLVDMQGKIVYAGSERNTHGVLTVDISSYPPGLYHIQLHGEQIVYYGRFVKQD